MKRFFSKILLVLIVFGIFFQTACQHTYKRADIKAQITELAWKEYKLKVEVEDIGQTILVHFEMRDFISELFASDQFIWKQIENIIMVLSRVALSCDKPPTFMVLDVRDPNNKNIHLVFTRHTRDIRKLMAEGISRTQYMERLIIELIVGDRVIPFDPQELDFVRLMMLVSDSMDPDKKYPATFKGEDVDMESFLSKAGANMIRRIFREDYAKQFQAREVSGSFGPEKEGAGMFRFVLDLAPLDPTHHMGDLLRNKTYPLLFRQLEEMFWSYQFKNFSSLQLVEKNLSITSKITPKIR